MTPEFRAWNGQGFDYCTLRARKGSSPQESGIWYDLIQTRPQGVVFGTLTLFQGEEKLEQYTGLKDVKGNKIFEGDIVESIDEEWSTGGLITGTVQYLAPHFTFDSAGVGRPGIWKVMDDGCQVIGNIHENPELLEVEK